MRYIVMSEFGFYIAAEKEYIDANPNIKIIAEVSLEDLQKHNWEYYIKDDKFYFGKSEETIITELRQQRETECFSVINRGQLWYETLTETQKEELKIWYQAWLNVTETKVIPEKPSWLK